MLIYLGLSALVVMVATLAFLLLGEPSVLAATHLFFALAVLQLVFAAIAHFVPVLTRSAGAPRGIWLAPLLLQVTVFGFPAFFRCGRYQRTESGGCNFSVTVNLF